MKDENLQKEFEEYFKCVNISDDITADAKAQVKHKRSIMPKIVKFASIAASIVLVFAVTLTLIFSPNFKNTSPEDGMSNSGAAVPDASGGAGTPMFELYTDSDLTKYNQSAYSISSLNNSLRFIENIAYAQNATVETCTAGYRSGKLALVTAEVSIVNGLKRDETTVFVEFTDEKLIYYELADYYNGKVYNYFGAQYFLTEKTAENGEPEFKLHILYYGVKYYFSVRSSDIKAYEKYLNMVTGK